MTKHNKTTPPSKKNLFKPYNQDQLMLIPPSLDEMIEKNHPVRTLSSIIDKLDLDVLEKEYLGGGCSSYNPKMLLKIVVYSYLCNVYSSRKIETALKENIHFMWLSAMSRPDHNTINRFRGDRLKSSALKRIFTEVVLLLSESGQLTLNECFLDGTKIEANANKYTFVWAKAIKTSKERIKRQLEEIWQYTQVLSKQEESDSMESLEFEQISKEKVEETIKKIDEALKQAKESGHEVDKKLSQKVNYALKNWPESLDRYDDQEKILQGRNSFSKTDHDATFMRMKEDYMKNGQLKAGYNVQIMTNNQFIVSYTLHSSPNDLTTLPSHLDSFKNSYNILPEKVVADAGYGSQENYEYMEINNIEPYVKYNSFEKDSKKKNAADGQFSYDKEKDCYFCPKADELSFAGNLYGTTTTGFNQTYSIYQNKDCRGCPLKNKCNPQYEAKKIKVNHRLNQLKQNALELLKTEEGIYFRLRRGHEVESVFGNIKQNKGFRRFHLRGKEKVEVETGLIALSHNLKKAKLIN